jgi:hypothetical protein
MKIILAIIFGALSGAILTFFLMKDPEHIKLGNSSNIKMLSGTDFSVLRSDTELFRVKVVSNAFWIYVTRYSQDDDGQPFLFQTILNQNIQRGRTSHSLNVSRAFEDESRCAIFDLDDQEIEYRIVIDGDEHEYFDGEGKKLDIESEQNG